MFLPTTRKEMQALGWNSLDVILVTGDAYIDSPFIGVSIIGKVLLKNGFRVGIIAQPDTGSDRDISRLGEPSLFWGVTAGCVDSMVANYTPLNKKRKSDDYTPGGYNTRRPDRASIAYTNLIKRYFKHTCPIVLGGIEASLRRTAHYDYKSGSIRRAILFDAKADFLLYGMAHNSVIDFADALKKKESPEHINGLAFVSKKSSGLEMPAFEHVKKDKKAFIRSFEIFYANNDPVTAQRICQKHGDRYIILNPPSRYTSGGLDDIHSMNFERDAHPFYKKQGKVKAVDTIRFSIPSHYGCYGGCHFCAISVHQGQTVVSRSENSILKEAAVISGLDGFKGYITDLGGPTANMYGFECAKKLKKGSCPDKRCLSPEVCSSMVPDHSRQIRLIKKIEQLPGVKKVFISSGIRYNLILADKKHGRKYLEKIVRDNISGQMKIAPEHIVPRVLELMGKQDNRFLTDFKKMFDDLSRQSGKQQFLTYYFIAAHPGCTMDDMKALKTFASLKLRTIPRQVQIFTPTPSTWSTVMYHTRSDPFSGEALFVETDGFKKEKQKKIITEKKAKEVNKLPVRIRPERKKTGK